MISQHILAPNRHEHVALAVFKDNAEASRCVAREIAALIRERQRQGRRAVLGLATGSTPLGLYAELVRMHREEGLSFANVVTFNLDEYQNLPPGHPQSYHHFMWTHLFAKVDIPAANTHIPDGNAPAADAEESCRRYEQAIAEAGGIDIQILGIGRTGHIGFNEPGSARRSRTRFVTLAPLPRRDAASDFGGEEHTPRQAVSMGVRTILGARRVMLLAWGQHKAPVVRAAVEGEVTPHCPASFLQEHDNALFITDLAAAGELTRHRAPWLLGPLEDQGLEWDARMTRRAIIWLSLRRKKAILKLTNDDYNESGLQDLLRIHGSAYDANLAGFYQMQHTITGWPGGRDPARTRPGDAPSRPLRSTSAAVFPKRILIFSAHPDNAVIGMGGTLCRLVEHGHDVHVACQVSGANAISDEALWRALLFARDTIDAASPGTPPPDFSASALCAAFENTGALPAAPEITRLKALVRRHESMAAARVCGVPLDHLHFLDLPFYHHDADRHRKLADADLRVMRAILDEIRPHQIFATGDLNDPHGTHRLCLNALRDALALCAADKKDWVAGTELWLYRGAWASWGPDEIDMAVPLSPQEVLRRRRAIFRHATQKDTALFAGDDHREFWQRSEDRGRAIADAYNILGLAEYEAIEAFKRYSPEEFLGHAQL
ncbi:glucosamine-6-phosphate deaminase [Termitidicoccus mucosus]|uniref:Glucosamine-6-phosphate deaminase n=1 Tax=Termitidicoccus mucosus TaxID=1184151 RepID=A0A178IMX1_9BACT|nr:glucosamine-6-phosphate deaminase [Opitutaceae bacterium TSB47]